VLIKISGKKLLGRFGWTCAQGRLEQELMLQCDFDELKSHIEINADPDDILLTLCFPSLVRKLRAFAKNLSQNMWAYDVVMKFLQQHQGSGGDCSVSTGTIIAENGDGTVLILCDSKTLVVRNPLNLPLDPIAPVLVHYRSIFAQID
jgi:hypothetical protein